MKQFLAICCGSSERMEEWMKLPEEERKQKEMEGMKAWDKWMTDHASVVKGASPLGKTTRADKNGLSEVKNNMGGWTLVEAESKEEAAKLFLNHPHYMNFPGEYIDIMECLPMPKM